MKFLIIGDLHGRKPKIFYRDYDAIISTGDFCFSDKLRPLAFKAVKERMKNPKSKIKWYDLVSRTKAKQMLKESFERGRIVLERMDSLGVPIFIVPGNAEDKFDLLHNLSYKKLLTGLENVVDTHEKMAKIGDYQIIGYGISSGPEYPQYDEDKERLRKKLKRLRANYNKTYGKLSSLFKLSSSPVILLSHNVPFNTSLDKITHRESPRYGYHYGSLIVRKLIERYNPVLSIGGHMHENIGKDKIGRTVCINAGLGNESNILLEMKGNKIKRLAFHH